MHAADAVFRLLRICQEAGQANLGVTESRQNRDVKCKAAKAPEKTACFFLSAGVLADETFYLVPENPCRGDHLERQRRHWFRGYVHDGASD